MTVTDERVVGPTWDWGDRLRKVRRTVADLTQGEMAELLGVKLPTYGAWEGGRNAPTLRMAIQIAQLLEREFPGKVSAAWMLGGDASLPWMDSNHQPPDWRSHTSNHLPDKVFRVSDPQFIAPQTRVM